MRRSTRIRYAARAVWLGLLLILSACGEPTGSRQPLPLLHLPYVARIPGAERLTASGPYQIEAIATYVPADGDTQAHLLALVAGELYDMGIDGSNVHEVSLAHSCFRSLSVTPDGRWGACEYTQGREQGIEIFGLSGAGQGKSSAIAGDPARLLITPSWAPDGKHLAAGNRSRDDSDGMVDIYTAAPNYDGVRVTAHLTFPFTIVDDVSWSADGTWLAVSGATSFQAGIRPYLVRMKALEGRVYGHEDAPVTLAVGSDDLLPFNAIFTWLHRAVNAPETQLTVVGDAGHHETSIVQRNVLTGQETTPLVVLPTGGVCGLSWTPDDRHLIFVYCGRFSDIRMGPPAQLYVYTPPN